MVSLMHPSIARGDQAGLKLKTPDSAGIKSSMWFPKLVVNKIITITSVTYTLNVFLSC